jgi:hypothetical protein
MMSWFRNLFSNSICTTYTEAKARAAELAIPGKVAALAKSKVAAAAAKADEKVRRFKSSAAAVRGEIEKEVGKELELAQAQIDEARRSSSEAEAARDQAQVGLAPFATLFCGQNTKSSMTAQYC